MKQLLQETSNYTERFSGAMAHSAHSKWTHAEIEKNKSDRTNKRKHKTQRNIQKAAECLCNKRAERLINE
jgi:enterochelin esterase-like enzyme